MKGILIIVLLIVPFLTTAQLMERHKQRIDSIYGIAMDTQQSKEVRRDAFQQVSKTIYKDLPYGLEIVLNMYRFSVAVGDVHFKVYSAHFIGYGYLAQGDTDSAFHYYREGLQLSFEHDKPLMKSTQAMNVGITHLALGNLDSTHYYNKMGLVIAQEKGYKRLQSRAHLNLGEVHYLWGDADSSIYHYKRALTIGEEIKEYGYYASIYMGMGDVYLMIGEYETAEVYYRKALRSAKINRYYLKLVQTHEKLASLELIRGDANLAFKSFQTAASLAEKHNLRGELAQVQIGLGEWYRDQNDYVKAHQKLDSALQLLNELNAIRGLERAFSVKASIYQKSKDFVMSRLYFEKAYDLAHEKKSKELIQICYALFEVCKELQDSGAALKYFEEFNELERQRSQKNAIKELIKLDYDRKFVRDSLIADSKAKEERLEHQQEMEERNNRTRIAYIGLGALALTLLVFVYFWRIKVRLNRELEEKNRLVEQSLKEKGLLFKELHHRVKNNMQVVSSLLQLKAKNAKDPAAKEALLESKLRLESMQIAHQKIFDSENFDQVDLVAYAKDLIGILKHSILDESCTVYFSGGSVDVNIEQAQAVGFILHELITNSTKYAWGDQNTDKEITVHIKAVEDKVILMYKDNGYGLPDGLEISNISSFGLQFIHSLIQRQLLGEIVYQKNNGATFEISFTAR